MRANQTWVEAVDHVFHQYENIVSPRGQEVREVNQATYTVDWNYPVVTNKSRNLNYKFMFGEAAWILSGSNDVETISSYMKSYAKFSDDNVTLNGAYGPKIIDQMSWAAKELAKDNDTRRCYINIWRERPGESKDIPCTVGMQFMIRDGKLNLFVNMRSQDVVLGMPYDIFSFSMIAKAMQLMLYKTHDIAVVPGELKVTVNSLHIYEQHYADVADWLTCDCHRFAVDTNLSEKISNCLTPSELIQGLRELAELW